VDAWVLIRFVHLLAVAFFVGGQMALVAFMPIVRRKQDPELTRALARRFGLGSLVALALLLATGAAMAAEYDRWGDGNLQAKLALLAGLGVLTALHVFTPRTRELGIAVFAVSLAIVLLGVSLAH
jgi:hypothetical protein